jgi:hypothetical protein
MTCRVIAKFRSHADQRRRRRRIDNIYMNMFLYSITGLHTIVSPFEFIVLTQKRTIVTADPDIQSESSFELSEIDSQSETSYSSEQTSRLHCKR